MLKGGAADWFMGIATLSVGSLLSTSALGANTTAIAPFDLFDPRYAIVWSGVLGATVAAVTALLGVLAANSSSLKRLDRQHKFDSTEAIAQRAHDATQKTEDRKAAIRREVYLKAIEETHGVLASIGGFVERPLSDSETDTDALQLFLKANAKIWLVAEGEAAHLCRELASLVSELYLRTLRETVPLRVAREIIRQLDKTIARLEAAPDQSTVPEGAIEALTEKRDEHRNARHRDLIAHVVGNFDNLRPVQATMVALVASLRHELGLSRDLEAFMLQLSDMETRALAAIDAIRQTLPDR